MYIVLCLVLYFNVEELFSNEVYIFIYFLFYVCLSL